MSSIGTGYDLSVSTYSPDGRVFQVEYANKAVENAGTAIALRVQDGVVFAVEKLIQSKLLIPGSNRRIASVDDHAGMVTAGLLADGRHLANRARDEADGYGDNYHTQIPLKILADRIGLYCQAFTLYTSVRPFGVSAIIGGVDKIHGPALYCIEPSGLYWGYRGCAIGKGRQLANTEIEKLKLEEMTCREAIEEAARIIYMVHDEVKDKDFELEMSWVGPESNGRHTPVPKDLQIEAERKAKEGLDADMED